MRRTILGRSRAKHAKGVKEEKLYFDFATLAALARGFFATANY